MFQETIIVGRLGRDPEMRYTPQGTPVTNLNVAVNERWTDGSGNAQERTIWFDVATWRRQAETCNEFLKKGSKVLIRGSLQEPRPYQDRDGKWKANLRLTANQVQFLDDAPAQ